jgi:hypothetical protein
LLNFIGKIKVYRNLLKYKNVYYINFELYYIQLLFYQIMINFNIYFMLIFTWLHIATIEYQKLNALRQSIEQKSFPNLRKDY